MNDTVVSAYMVDGKCEGVRVTLGDNDFVIALHDLSDKEMPWNDAMKALKKQGKTTWDYRQICLTMAYRKEVNDCLLANGGDVLRSWYWTRAECSAYYAYDYYGNSGILYNYTKVISSSVRPVLALGKN